MVRAMRHMAQDCKDGAFDPEEITEEKFASYLDTKDLPDPEFEGFCHCRLYYKSLKE